jgi:hypothetical protein
MAQQGLQVGQLARAGLVGKDDVAVGVLEHPAHSIFKV